MATNPTTYQLVGETRKDTAKAVLLLIDSIDGKEIIPPNMSWYPKSQIVEICECQEDPTKEVYVAKHWIVEGNGLLK